MHGNPGHVDWMLIDIGQEYLVLLEERAMDGLCEIVLHRAAQYGGGPMMAASRISSTKVIAVPQATPIAKFSMVPARIKAPCYSIVELV